MKNRRARLYMSNFRHLHSWLICSLMKRSRHRPLPDSRNRGLRNSLICSEKISDAERPWSCCIPDGILADGVDPWTTSNQSNLKRKDTDERVFCITVCTNRVPFLQGRKAPSLFGRPIALGIKNPLAPFHPIRLNFRDPRLECGSVVSGARFFLSHFYVAVPK